MRGPVVALEIVFGVEEPDAEGRSWVTVRVGGGSPAMAVGYVKLFDADSGQWAAHGSADGWPPIAICADPTRALSAVIAAWGRETAE